MTPFKIYFENYINVIALMPGGFKPPTVGHFNALKFLSTDAEKAIVFIGKKERDGITCMQAQKIWEIYANYFNIPIEIQIAAITPVRSIYEFVDKNLDKYVLVGAGNKDEDIARFNYFNKHKDKYQNVKVVKIPIQSGGISGTKTRQLIQSDIRKAIEYFVPPDVSATDKDYIRDILTQTK